MDVLSYWHVIQRQRRIVVVGLTVTTVLALIAAVKISPSGISYRSPGTYTATSTLFVTQEGSPWGRLDPTRMQYLAALYAEFATTDAVRYRVLPLDSPDSDSFTATALKASDGTTLPLIEITGESTTGERAIEIARTASNALRRYVVANQNANNVPESTRVALPLVVGAREAEVLRGPRRTPAIMLFLLGLAATLVMAFTVDNTRRRPAAVAPASETFEPVSVVPVVPEPEEEQRGVAAAAVVASDSAGPGPELDAVEPAGPAVAEERRPWGRPPSSAPVASASDWFEPVSVVPVVPEPEDVRGVAAAAVVESAGGPELDAVEPAEPVVAEEPAVVEERRPWSAAVASASDRPEPVSVVPVVPEPKDERGVAAAAVVERDSAGPGPELDAVERAEPAVAEERRPWSAAVASTSETFEPVSVVPVVPEPDDERGVAAAAVVESAGGPELDAVGPAEPAVAEEPVVVEERRPWSAAVASASETFEPESLVPVVPEPVSAERGVAAAAVVERDSAGPGPELDAVGPAEPVVAEERRPWSAAVASTSETFEPVSVVPVVPEPVSAERGVAAAAVVESAGGPELDAVEPAEPAVAEERRPWGRPPSSAPVASASDWFEPVSVVPVVPEPDDERGVAAAAVVERDSAGPGPELDAVEPAEPAVAEEPVVVEERRPWSAAVASASETFEPVSVVPVVPEPVSAERGVAAAAVVASDSAGPGPELDAVEPAEPAVAEERRRPGRRARDAQGRFVPAHQASNE